MKRVLADHNVPAPLLRLLKAFDIRMASELGLQAVQNGKLLAAAEAAGFDVLLSSDKKIKDELIIAGRNIAMVSMSDNRWPGVGEYAGVIMQAIEKVKLDIDGGVIGWLTIMFRKKAPSARGDRNSAARELIECTGDKFSCDDDRVAEFHNSETW